MSSLYHDCLAFTSKHFLPKNEKATKRSQTTQRWLMLVLSCLSLLGSYYCYDIPSALSNQIEKVIGINDFKLNILYSVYSFPNTILPLFGGYFVDKFGVGICLLVFQSFLTVGQALFSIGVASANYSWMVIGRVLFGFGGESLGVANSVIIALYFQDKELAFALGITLSFSRLGSVFNDNMSLYLFNHGGLSAAAWFGFFTCVLSLFSIFCIIIIDNLTVTQLETNYEAASGETVPVDPPVDMRDILNFSKLYWLITASCLSIYSAILPFNNISDKILVTRFGIPESEANALLGVPFIISACISPFLGFLVDKIACRGWFMLGSSLLLCCGHTVIGFTTIYPVFGLILIGLSYSFYAAAIWASIAYVVEKERLGSAYGVTTAVQNSGLAFVPMLSGVVYSYTNSYTYVEALFLGLAYIGVLIGIAINVEDVKNNNILNVVQPSFEIEEKLLDEPINTGNTKDGYTTLA